MTTNKDRYIFPYKLAQKNTGNLTWVQVIWFYLAGKLPIWNFFCVRPEFVGDFAEESKSMWNPSRIFPLKHKHKCSERSIFQTFWKVHCCTKSLFFEFETYLLWLLHSTYSWNIKRQKCARMGLNGFISKKIWVKIGRIGCAI